MARPIEPLGKFESNPVVTFMSPDAIVMRLTPEQVQLIRQTAEGILGADIQITLFGSRLNDLARGGDIDLLVTIPHAVGRPALLAARLAAKLERNLGGRRVDVVLVTPETPPQPIHQIARQQGVPL